MIKIQNCLKILLTLLLVSLITITIVNSINTATAANVDTIYVNGQSGNDSNDGLTLETPKKTIKAGIDALSNEGTVNIASGTYYETGLTIAKNVKIVGDGVTIDGQNNDRILNIQSGIVTISGIKFQKGIKETSSYEGGAIYMVKGVLTIENCVFINNKAEEWGGAIYQKEGYLNVKNCNFKGNIARGGGAIYQDAGTITIESSAFTSNTANEGGAICTIYQSTSTITHCTFIANMATNGGAIKNQGTCNVNNCIFDSNKADQWGGAIYDYGQFTIISCTLTGNTASAGGVIYNDNIVNAHFCRFIGNIPDNDVISTNGYLNAENNWWGSDDNPRYHITKRYVIIGSIHVDPWIVLSLNTTDAYFGYNSTVTADLLHNNRGNYLDPSGGHVPDYIKVSFSSGDGKFDPTSTLLVDGQSKSFFTPDSASAMVNVSVDGQSILKQLTVNSLTTSIAVDNISSFNGKTVNLTASLTDQKGSPVTGKNITFKLNGTYIGTATTNNKGIATLNYTITQTEGNYNITSDFTGDYIYVASTGAGNLKINTINTNIIINNISSINGKTVNLTANLTDINQNPLAGKIVTFSLNGDTVGNAVTGENGIATVSYKLNRSGNYPLTADFTGDYVYVASRGAGEAAVVPVADLYLNSKISSKDIKTGDKFIIICKLGNEGLDTAKNITLTFKIPKGLEFQNSTTDNGNWTYNSKTRTVECTMNSVPLGKHYLFLSVKAVSAGNYTISPTITSATYNRNTSKTGVITINVKSQSNNNRHKNNHNDIISNAVNAWNDIIMQKTGLPLNYLLLAIILVLSCLVPKRK